MLKPLILKAFVYTSVCYKKLVICVVKYYVVVLAFVYSCKKICSGRHILNLNFIWKKGSKQFFTESMRPRVKIFDRNITTQFFT